MGNNDLNEPDLIKKKGSMPIVTQPKILRQKSQAHSPLEKNTITGKSSNCRSIENRQITLGEENIENNDDLNCTPCFNLKMYQGSRMQQIKPKDMMTLVNSNYSIDFKSGTYFCRCGASDKLSGCCRYASKWLALFNIDMGKERQEYRRVAQSQQWLIMKMKNSLTDDENLKQIENDVNRTFEEYSCFSENKSAVKRLLMSMCKAYESIGYVQGMNYIAAVLVYHAGEEAAFALFKVLISNFNLKKVLQHGFPGLKVHNKCII